MTAPIVAIDTETTDLDTRRRLAWDVAMIRRDPDGHEHEYQFFIDVDLTDAAPIALKIGGYYERHPLGKHIAGGPTILDRPRASGEYVTHRSSQLLTPRAAALTIAQVTHGAHLVGAIPSFDAATLEELLRDNGLTPAWHYHIIDVEAMAVGFLAGTFNMVRPPWKSDDIGKALGVEPPSEEDRHTALGDARMALRWYDTIMGTGRVSDKADHGEPKS